MRERLQKKLTAKAPDTLEAFQKFCHSQGDALLDVATSVDLTRNYLKKIQDTPRTQADMQEQQHALKGLQEQEVGQWSLDKLCFVHITGFLPMWGVILPRSTIEIPLFPSEVSDVLSVIRLTVHGTFNSLVTEHSKCPVKGSCIIIDPLSKQRKAQFRAGTFDDVFLEGPYILSENAVVLLKETERDGERTLQFIQSLPPSIRVEYYSGHPEQAVRKFLKDTNRPYFDTASVIAMNPDMTAHYATLDEKKFISGEKLFRHLGILYCDHAAFPTRQIEILLKWVPTLPPYLEYLHYSPSPKMLLEVGDYIDATLKLNPTEPQKLFLNKAKHVLQDLMELFRQPTSVEQLQEACIKEMPYFQYYDAPPALKKTVPQEKLKDGPVLSALHKLLASKGNRGVFFACYRRGTEQIVDAVAELQALPAKPISMLKKLLGEQVGDTVYAYKEGGKDYVVIPAITHPRTIKLIMDRASKVKGPTETWQEKVQYVDTPRGCKYPLLY